MMDVKKNCWETLLTCSFGVVAFLTFGKKVNGTSWDTPRFSIWIHCWHRSGLHVVLTVILARSLKKKISGVFLLLDFKDLSGHFYSDVCYLSFTICFMVSIFSFLCFFFFHMLFHKFLTASLSSLLRVSISFYLSSR